jgi:hypothetical protein
MWRQWLTAVSHLMTSSAMYASGQRYRRLDLYVSTHAFIP